MTEHDWVEKCASELRVSQKPYPDYRFVSKPTTTALDQFQEKHNLVLPASYRDFVLGLGAGELAGFFRIAAPLDAENDYHLDTFNRQLHGEPEERLLAVYGPQAEIDAFYFFCATGGDAFFGWKTDTPSAAKNFEYPIYEFPGFPPFRKVADSFQEFVLDYILTPSSERRWTPQKVFAPFQVEV